MKDEYDVNSPNSKRNKEQILDLLSDPQKDTELYNIIIEELEKIDYRFIKPLNKEGAMAKTYLVMYDLNNEIRLFKLYKMELNKINNQKIRKFDEKLASINHKNIVQLYNTGSIPFKDAFYRYSILEFISDSKSLEEYKLNIFQEKHFKTRIRIALTITSTLVDLRRNGIVHGDLHEGNILILPDNNVKIIDPGSSRLTTQEYDSDYEWLIYLFYKYFFTKEELEGEFIKPLLEEKSLIKIHKQLEYLNRSGEIKRKLIPNIIPLSKNEGITLNIFYSNLRRKINEEIKYYDYLKLNYFLINRDILIEKSQLTEKDLQISLNNLSKNNLVINKETNSEPRMDLYYISLQGVFYYESTLKEIGQIFTKLFIKLIKYINRIENEDNDRFTARVPMETFLRDLKLIRTRQNFNLILCILHEIRGEYIFDRSADYISETFIGEKDQIRINKEKKLLLTPKGRNLLE